MTLPDDLMDGYRRFRRAGYSRQAARYRELAEKGQFPAILVIACCDSRADPALIFDAGPGELFVVRNVANLVPPAERDISFHGTSAALEFGVTALGVQHVLVLGHGNCGGIQAARQKSIAHSSGFLRRWISLLDPVCEELTDLGGSEDERQRTYEEAGIRLSLDRLRSFDFVAERMAGGRLRLHGAHFDIASGRLSVLSPETGRFVAIAAAQ